MKVLKKITAALTAAALITGISTACSTDKSWAMKNSSLTVPVGTYIYYLYNAYSSAQNSVPDTSKPVLDQKIDNTDATTWIRNKAMTYTKSLFVIDQKMKDLKLKLTDAETKQVSDTTDSMWGQYQSELQKFGIAKSSFNLGYADYYTKYQKVFTALYGKGGSKEVTDAQLKDFYVKSYTDFNYIACPLYTADENGSFKAALSDADKKKLEDEINGYAAQIKDGKMTIQQAADAYQKSSKATSSPLQSETINLATDTNYPDEFKNVVKAMGNGDVKTAEFKDLYTYVLVVKNDISTKANDQLKSNRSSVLSDFKGKEFSDEITKEADALKDISVNDGAINSYNPSMFVSASSAPASSAEAAASQAASAPASK